MGTRTAPPATPRAEGSGELLARYDCGPVPFTGAVEPCTSAG